MSDAPNDSRTFGTFRESRTFILALIVVVSFIVFFGYALFIAQDLIVLEKVTALFGGFMAAVLGYYFGQRPVQAFAQRVSSLEEEKQDIQNKYNETLFSNEQEKQNFEDELTSIETNVRTVLNRIKQEKENKETPNDD